MKRMGREKLEKKPDGQKGGEWWTRGRAPDCQLRGQWFNLIYCHFETLAISFTPHLR